MVVNVIFASKLKKNKMKKVFVVCLVLAGAAMVLKGVLALFSLEFNSISNDHASYDLGANLGLLVSKLGRIGIGIFLINYGYSWFCDENRIKN
jgi:hypothetical protein